MSPVVVMWVVTATLLVMLWFGRQNKFTTSPLHPMIIGWLVIITCVTAVCAVVVTVRARVSQLELHDAVALPASSYDGSLDEVDIAWITRAAERDLGKALDWANATSGEDPETDSGTAHYEVAVGRYASTTRGTTARGCASPLTRADLGQRARPPTNAGQGRLGKLRRRLIPGRESGPRRDQPQSRSDPHLDAFRRIFNQKPRPERRGP